MHAKFYHRPFRQRQNVRGFYAGLGGLLLAVLTLHGCGRGETPVHVSQFDAFGARVDVQILGAAAPLATDLAQQIERDFTLIDYTFGLDRPGPMQRVNELLATSEPFAAPPALLPLLRQSQDLAVRSRNLFNPAIGLLIQLWQFDPETGDCQGPPAPAAIARVLEAEPTLAELSLDGIELLSDDPAVKLDFGAVRQAYALDVAMTNLRQHGVRSALIRMGGHLQLIGNRAGQPWRITIPRGSGGGVLGVMDVQNAASVITIGHFQQPCLYQGQHYARILDPRTGYPVTGTQLVTVLHRGDAVTAAAAATALFVAGPEQWVAVAQDMGIRAALLIDDAGVVHLSPAMEETLQIIDRNAQMHLSSAWSHATSGE